MPGITVCNTAMEVDGLKVHDAVAAHDGCVAVKHFRMSYVCVL